MKNTKRYIGMAMMAAGMLAATSCSDFDDYNSAVTDATPSASLTLWENISQNSQLSDFAQLLRRVGYDDVLSQTQYYTVWAPLNGYFDASVFQAYDNEALLRQFVKNHIANYAHGASGTLNERVLMLNDKSYSFEGNGSYTFDETALSQANVPSSNGLLHVLNGLATFYPNIYEYITDKGLSADADIDSLRQYYLAKEETYLDTEHSVLGSIVDGMQTYIDSVLITENSLWYTLNAKIQSEDSAYTFLLPTNKAWASSMERIKSCYNYLDKTTSKYYVQNEAQDDKVVEVAGAYWQDSLTNEYLTRYLSYSNNNPYNQWLVREASSYGTDTLQTTRGRKVSNPADLFAQAVRTVKMSNGTGYIVDSLAVLPWESFNPELNVRTSSSQNLAHTYQSVVQTVTVKRPDPSKVDVDLLNNGSLSYIWADPSNPSTSVPRLTFKLHDVRSTTYDIYCVFVPQSVEMGDSTVSAPNRVIFTLNYCDANGNLQDRVFLDERQENIDNYISTYNQRDNSTNRNAIRAFSNDPERVDTIYVGEFTFPACYYGLDDDLCPMLTVSTPLTNRMGSAWSYFSRALRIGAIILKPKELVEFEESNN